MLEERNDKRYLRKKHLRRRYGDMTDRSIERMVKDGRLPPPDLYQGRIPLWAEDVLDEHDARAAVEYARTTAQR
jgi:hypothetical protein